MVGFPNLYIVCSSVVVPGPPPVKEWTRVMQSLGEGAAAATALGDCR